MVYIFLSSQPGRYTQGGVSLFINPGGIPRVVYPSCFSLPGCKPPIFPPALTSLGVNLPYISPALASLGVNLPIKPPCFSLPGCKPLY